MKPNQWVFSRKSGRTLCWIYLPDFAVFRYEPPQLCQEEPALRENLQQIGLWLVTFWRKFAATCWEMMGIRCLPKCHTKVTSPYTVPAVSTQDLGLAPLPCWAKWWNLEMWWQTFGGSLLPRYAPNWYSGDSQKRWEKTEGLDLWQQKKADFSQKMLEVESPQCISIIIYASQHQFMNCLHWSPSNHGGQPSQIHAVSSFCPLTPPAYDIWGRSSLALDKG